MSNLVIVAIPDENDHVWKVSSEKVPHLTLLFLGEMDEVQNLDQIIQFVEHAADLTLRRFYLTVDRRGELGEDKADVLFFKPNRHDARSVQQFRTALLQNSSIRTAYDSTTQFEGSWNPHLTLGYPETPAKPDDRDFGFYEVGFNKIAVWTDDFDGLDFLLKDQWDEFDSPEVAMSVLSHAKVSDTPWSQFKDSDYDDAQYARACLLDRGEGAGTAKQRYGLPVREPSGTVNRNACHAAAAVLSSTGGTGSARGHKVKGTPEQIAAAKKKLVSLYKNTLEEDVPKGLGGSMEQTVDLGAEFLEHYGTKGMKWGVRNTKGGSNTSGVGETKREGIQRFLDPQGHQLSSDIAKTAIGTLVPVVAPLTWPSQVRLMRGGVRGAKAKALDRQEKKFEKKAMSPKNFAAIHNGSLDKINRDVDGINKKYPDLSKPATKKKYDDEVLKSMQDGYRQSANSLSNKSRTMHLDVEFKNDGADFLIHAREGAPTPLPQRVKHAADDENEEITIEITGKIKRDDTGHILGLEFDHLKSGSMAQSAFDLGTEFMLEHYGIKGMRWGFRREMPTAVTPTAVSKVPHGAKRKTKIKTEGGENHPAHEDAIKVAEARIKLKKSGTAALSNQELREVANRLQLEAQVATLSTSRGQKFVMRELETGSKQIVKRGAKQGAKRYGPKVVKKAGKTAATVATTAALL